MSFSSVLTGISDRINGVYTKYNTAIILAGGSSTRIGGSKTKQLVPILGIPTVVRTVSVFEKCKFINEIIIVAPSLIELDLSVNMNIIVSLNILYMLCYDNLFKIMQ